MKTIVLSGALANKPFNGGNAWSRLGWILGFRRLGFDVLFVEQINRNCLVDGSGAAGSPAASINLAFFRAVMEAYGLESAASLVTDDGQAVWGLSFKEVLSRSRKSVLLFNFGGHLTLSEIFGAPGCRVYFDDDPGFTQFWQAAGHAGHRLDGHEWYFTLGVNIGDPGCRIPVGRQCWRPTRPPVVLERWPGMPAGTFDRFTTVASWRGAYGPVEFGGERYGLKVHEFRKFMDLPRRCGMAFEVALDIHPGDRADREALQERGWKIVDPVQSVGTPRAYQEYLRSSGAEFSVAQEMYVKTRSGWFSDRTARYLASGRPALVQDTGLGPHYPVGRGLVTFGDLEEAVEGAHRICRDYSEHCRAARHLAEEYFDSDKIIREILSTVGVALP